MLDKSEGAINHQEEIQDRGGVEGGGKGRNLVKRK